MVAVWCSRRVSAVHGHETCSNIWRGENRGEAGERNMRGRDERGRNGRKEGMMYWTIGFLKQDLRVFCFELNGKLCRSDPL